MEIGTGILNWPNVERIGDRYGVVGLWDDGHTLPLAAPLPEGIEGELVAEVLETRESHHIGDLFRGLFPTTPNVGDRIVLGSGTLFRETKREGGDTYEYVGLRPDDGRDTDWLNPEALYRVHHQTVRLLFEPAA